MRHPLLCEVVYLWSSDDVIDRTQVKLGPPDSSPQQTATSRTVKRYPSSSGPITSNALPSGYANGHTSEQKNWHGHRNGHSNVHSFNTHRPGSDNQLHGQFTNALLPAGRNIKLNYHTSCCVIVKWNISHKGKISWQPHRRYFPFLTVHPPYTICGLHQSRQTDPY